MFHNDLRSFGYHGALSVEVARTLATDKFESLLDQGRVRRLWSKVRGHSWRLLELGRYVTGCTLRDQRYAGVQAVAINEICGSENRTEDFDNNFYPVGKHMKPKWVNVAIAALTGAQLPPVDLIQVGDMYFVRDGHNRISVARSLGQTHVDAVVTVEQMNETC